MPELNVSSSTFKNGNISSSSSSSGSGLGILVGGIPGGILGVYGGVVVGGISPGVVGVPDGGTGVSVGSELGGIESVGVVDGGVGDSVGVDSGVVGSVEDGGDVGSVEETSVAVSVPELGEAPPRPVDTSVVVLLVSKSLLPDELVCVAPSRILGASGLSA